MPEIATVLTFVLAAVVAAVVPGPTVAIVVASSLRRGARAGLAAVFGGQLALLLMTVVIAVGLEAVLGFMAWAFDFIKLLGAAYLVWLGWKLLTSKSGLEVESGGRAQNLFDYAMQGFLVVGANPKTLLFFGSFLPQFVDRDLPVFPQVLIFGALAMIVAMLSDGSYALLAGQARAVVTEARIRLVSRVSGIILMAGGAWLALQQRN
jgi:threonine/homoserine/homoserine lactone efflux protein